MWWKELKDNWHPEDKLSFPDEKREGYYRKKFDVAKAINPKSIFEIGVRAGYSAFSFLSAAPEAEYTGLDLNQGTDGGVVDYYKHAEKILDKFNATINIGNSQKLKKLDKVYDLIHIDGDHSFYGCLRDIELCVKYGRNILVDDYDYIDNVKRACEEFKINNPQYGYTYIPDGYHGNLLIVTGVK